MKVLLLTASYGTGHITATKSIYEVIKNQHPEWQVEIVDFLKINEKRSSEKLTFFQRLYNFSMEKPILFDIFFYLTSNIFCVYILEFFIKLINYKHAKKIFDKFQPDIFVSTHPYWTLLVKKYKREKNVPYICIITDSYMIHKAWIDKSVDYYCVIDEDTKHVLINNGIRNIFVTGFPVHPKLFEKIDKYKILSEIGLMRDKLTILITVGLGAIERFLEIINHLRERKENFQMIIITGKYKQIYDYLMNLKFIPPTKIIGWTDRMYDFIRVSDLIICKGGGAIVSESLSARLPVLIPLFVPGQEKGNAYIIRKYQMGFHEIDMLKIINILDKIINLEIDLKFYKENISKYIHHNPAEAVVKIIQKTVNRYL